MCNPDARRQCRIKVKENAVWVVDGKPVTLVPHRLPVFDGEDLRVAVARIIYAIAENGQVEEIHLPRCRVDLKSSVSKLRIDPDCLSRLVETHLPDLTRYVVDTRYRATIQIIQNRRQVIKVRQNRCIGSVLRRVADDINKNLQVTVGGRIPREVRCSQCHGLAAGHVAKSRGHNRLARYRFVRHVWCV